MFCSLEEALEICTISHSLSYIHVDCHQCFNPTFFPSFEQTRLFQQQIAETAHFHTNLFQRKLHVAELSKAVDSAS